MTCHKLLKTYTKKLLMPGCCLLLLALMLLQRVNAQTYYTVDQLPNPQVNGRTNVSDPDGILQSYETDSLNNLTAAMKKSTGVELAIAIVHDFEQKEDDFNFATLLFRKWGVGGAHSNNGLLLFVAVDRKKYRFITGYGMEGILPDGTLSTIGRQYLVPSFQQDAYGPGIIKAITVINNYLNNPANNEELSALLAEDNVKETYPWYVPVGIMVLLIAIYILLTRHLKKQAPVSNKKQSKARPNDYYDKLGAIVAGILVACFAAIFIIGFTIGFSWVKNISLNDSVYILYTLLAIGFALRYLNVLSIIRGSHTDDFNYDGAAYRFQKSTWWYVLFSPLVLIMIIREAIKRRSHRRRFVPQIDGEGHQLVRVDRDENPSGKPYLSAGQQNEEKCGVYSYDIWVGSNAAHFKIVTNEGSKFNSFDTCPKCGFKTQAHPVVETIIKATYSHEGQGKKVARCSFCQHEQLIKMVVLPMLTQSSSSSSSSGSGGGSSSSSSGSGSFGGGSTGGGGAGGSW